VSFTQFKLDARLQAGIKRAGFSDPTPIQIQAIPAALDGFDLIGTAQTGTGKTAAFVLPILHRLLSGPRNRSRALIVTPTRELAEQIHESIRVLSYGTKLRSATIYGGVGTAKQIADLQHGVEILVACPGRLLDLIAQGHANLSGIEVLVLDEADRMLDMGFLPDVRRIIKAVPAKRQTMLFSATFPDEIEELGRQTTHQPKRIAVGLSRPAHTVSHALYPVQKHLKTALLIELLKRTDTHSVLVFTRTRHRAHNLAKKIGREGFKVTSLHSDRTQGQRQSALNGFRDGKYQIMVATDIAARGLDVDSISHVINYDIPDTADAYIHRIGRTGRAERTGDAFTLVTPDDDEMIRTLEKIMKQRLPRQTLEDFDYAAAAPPVQEHAPRPPRQNAPRPKTGSASRHRGMDGPRHGK
jgi:ATP-dependent RNA helicase RhlE